MFGVAVGHYKIPPFSQLITLKKSSCNSKFRTPRGPDTIITYKKTVHGDLKLHMFYPENYLKKSDLPAAIFYFGGGWKNGTPKEFYPQCEHLSSLGMICVSAEYRVSSKHNTSPQQSVEDGKSAIRYLRKNAKEYNINSNMIVAGGGSAGGHIAAATGTVLTYDNQDENLSISSKPNALILFNAVIDNSQEGYGYDRVKYYWKDISPLHNITKTTPPTIAFLGTKDHYIPVKTAIEFKDKMLDKNIQSELYIYENEKHGFFNKSKYNETLEQMYKFLIELGYLNN